MQQSILALRTSDHPGPFHKQAVFQQILRHSAERSWPTSGGSAGLLAVLRQPALPPTQIRVAAPCREKLARAAEALQDFRRAAELEPHNREARQAVSRLQELPPPPPPPLSCAADEGSCQGATSQSDGTACVEHEHIIAAGGDAARQHGVAGGGVAAAGDGEEMLR